MLFFASTQVKANIGSDDAKALRATIYPNTSRDVKQPVTIIDATAFLATARPTNVSGGVGGLDIDAPYEDQTSIYEVKPGDTWAEIAGMYNVSVNTILWANDMKRGDKLVPGDVLLILPVSGLEHTVIKGQTLKGIATLYKADINEILQSNGIAIDTQLVVGEKLIVPGAEMSAEPTTTTPKTGQTKNLATSKGKTGTISQSLPSVSGFFKNPVQGAKRSRGIQKGHGGVDLAAPTGTPIHAAASGKVLKAGTGYNGGFGTMAIIQHSNGTKTLYAHMSKLGTSTGETVSQGDTIGYVGSTGKSTGPHLHIEVLGGRNPF